MQSKLVHTPEGVRDIYGDEYSRKLITEKKIHDVFSSYGYRGIQTPSFEYFDVFSNEIGTTASKNLYKFFDKEGNTLVLRPDFTPSIARCAAKYFGEETGPLRFCYRGSAFINSSSLRGQLNEVTQMGCELINDSSVEAEAEILAMVTESLLSAGLTRIQISVGQVDYFRGLCSQSGLSEEMEYKIRDYISDKNCFGAEELLLKEGISRTLSENLLHAMSLFGGVEILPEAKKCACNEKSISAIEHLEKLYEALKAYNIEKYVSFDLGMLSKYNYYTGIIFKAFTYGVGDAVVGGGRYDTLLSHFGKNRPAVGFMIVADSLLEALRRQDIQISSGPEPEIIYYGSDNFPMKVREAAELRKKGISCELIPEEMR